MSAPDEGFYLAGGLAAADFPDADDSRPIGAYMEALGGSHNAIPEIVQQTLGRHVTEALPPRTSPQLTSFSMNTGNWRKRLREMMIRQNETVLGFLYKPSAEHSVIGPVEQALRRYALRQDVDTGAVKTLKSMLNDLSGSQQAQIDSEIEEAVLKKGTSNLSQIRAQVNAIVELYKETGEKLLDSENQLKLRLEKMDKIQRRVSTIIEMQTNEAMPELVAALEKYLKVSFREMGIEVYYKELIYLYQKHITLREAIQVFKIGNQASEPTCPICLTETIGMAIVPCGHTFCQTCAKRMVNECGVCRGRLRDRLRLFIS
jgi:hypothetical protein